MQRASRRREHGFAVSSYDGDFLGEHSDVAWDQHIVRIARG